MVYKERHIKKRVLECLDVFPIITLTGCRQSGKSTFLKHNFSNNWRYYSLDQRGLLERVESDPDLFVSSQKENFIIDEAQKCPSLFHAIKYLVDNGYPYKIILSGSANFLLLSKVTETLAGRTGILDLYPFSYSEINETTLSPFLCNIIKNNIDSLEKININKKVDILSHIFYGGLPKLFELKTDRQKWLWLENYRTTYLERDLRDLEQVASISDFQKYYTMLAFQTGNLLNYSNIGSDIGINTHTSKKYFSILNASYQYFTLQPYYSRIKKRLIRTPKVYIWDTGLGNFLQGYSRKEDLTNSGRFGSIFENWIIAELFKQKSFMDEQCNFFYFRTSNGAEVDLVIEHGNSLIPIEIKHSISLKKEELRGIDSFMESFSGIKNVPYGIILYMGENIQYIKKNILAIPVQSILGLLQNEPLPAKRLQNAWTVLKH